MLSERQSARDPVSAMLAFLGRLKQACAALAAEASQPGARKFFDEEIPGYRRYLEEALLPLLKRRLAGPADETVESTDVAIGWTPEATYDEAEDTLRREILLAETTLQRLDEDWRQLRHAPATSEQIADFVESWREHVAAMEERILPAVHAHLGAGDLDLLAQAMARHHGGHGSPVTG